VVGSTKSLGDNRCAPGMMKTPLISAVIAPARALEADWRTKYAEAQRKYEAEQERA